MKETWKDIPGYEGLYQVSDMGRVRSLDREVKCGRYGYTTLSGVILKSSLDHKGYIRVYLSKNNKKKTIRVHKLVAMAFLNHKPCGHKEVVDHINNDKNNNRLDNLQLVTNRENASKDRNGYTSNYVGVYWEKQTKKWRAAIYVNGKSIKLGRFDSEYDAHLAYQNELAKITA